MSDVSRRHMCLRLFLCVQHHFVKNRQGVLGYNSYICRQIVVIFQKISGITKLNIRLMKRIFLLACTLFERVEEAEDGRDVLATAVDARALDETVVGAIDKRVGVEEKEFHDLSFVYRLSFIVLR